MDTNNWRPTQGAESTMDTSDWRAQLPSESRHRIVNKILSLMDTNNWRPTQGAESTMDTSDWRAQLPSESRHRIVNKIMDTLKRHLPVSSEEGLHELQKIAQRFEEKIYTAATSQSDYLRKISLKMLTMETKSQKAMANSMLSNPGANSNEPSDPGLGMQSQVHNPEQSYPINLAYQAQSCQQLLSQNIQNNITASAVPCSACIAPGLTPASNVGQTSNQNVGPQQNLSGQNSVQIQSQPAQLQQQSGLQQQPNTLPQDMQHRLQAPGSLFQQQNLLDHQKQLYQSQRALPETSSMQTGQPSGGDWQEEVYQKIKTMKEAYLPEINEMYQKIAAKLQQHDSLLQQPKTDQLEKLKIFKTMLERIITFLQASKSSIGPHTREKLSSYEKQIVNFISTNKPRKAMPLMQGPLSQHHPMQSLQQSDSQVTQVLLSHENQMNSQLQSNLQGSVATMQQNNMTSLQQNSMPSISGVSTAQQNMMNLMQSCDNLDSGQENSANSLQQVVVSSLQQNPLSMPHLFNINTLTSQGGVIVLQPNLNPPQPGPSMLQHQQLKQQQEQMLQTQQLKQFQQRLMEQQFMQRQQMLQQQQQQQPSKQQMPAQLQTHQMPQLHQMNEMNDIKMRQGMVAKPFQQHLAPGQCPAYPHQQLKPGGPFPVSSPQLLQANSPQIPQHSSPQVDQQDFIPSITIAGAPLKSTNSPFVVPTPSPTLAPSPMPGDSEKPNSGASSIPNAANVGDQNMGGAAAPVQSLAIGTPGISASPLLAEFSVPDGPCGNALVATSGKSAVTEKPLECLIKAVKSSSPNALSATASDISSVVHMIDGIAGSAPGNGSRAAVGEDLVAVTNCCLQDRNFITQEGTNGTKGMIPYTSALPLNVASSAGSMNDSIKQFTVPEASDLESTATSRVKKPRIELYKKFFGNPSLSGVCTSMGRLLPEHYCQMMVATNMSDTLLQNSPFLVSVADCSTVEDTLGEISKKRCPRLSLFSSLVYVGMLLFIAAVMFSVVIWVVFV